MAEDDLTADYAVIGVGSIAEAIVTGLCEAPAPPSVVLSPRNRKRTARLGSRYPTVRVAADNQAAASAAGTVLLCLRPQDAVSVASATVAAHLAYLQTISSWLAGQGVELEDAQRLIASVFAGATAEFATSTDFVALVRHHATPGGLNEHFERALREAGGSRAVERALGALLDSIPVTKGTVPVTERTVPGDQRNRPR